LVWLHGFYETGCAEKGEGEFEKIYGGKGGEMGLAGMNKKINCIVETTGNLV
jgi:hypothetical protein